MTSLSDYLAEKRVTIRAFAAEAEVSPSFLSELTAKDEVRRKSPSLEVALRIQKASGGAVGVSDWPGLKAIADAVHAHKRADASPPKQDPDAQKVNGGANLQGGAA